MFICSAHTTRNAIDQCVRPGEGVAARSALLVKKNVLDCTARELIPIVCDDLSIDSNIWTGRLRESCRRRVVGAAEPCLVGAWQASRGCARLASRVGAAKSAEVAIHVHARDEHAAVAAIQSCSNLVSPSKPTQPSREAITDS